MKSCSEEEITRQLLIYPSEDFTGDEIGNLVSGNLHGGGNNRRTRAHRDFGKKTKAGLAFSETALTLRLSVLALHPPLIRKLMKSSLARYYQVPPPSRLLSTGLEVGKN